MGDWQACLSFPSLPVLHQYQSLPPYTHTTSPQKAHPMDSKGSFAPWSG